MSKQAVVTAFRKHCAPALKARGFVSRRGHFVRRVGAVTQIIEIQHSIYGGRVTANLGLDLEWLRPLIRWIPQPVVGPHAHDATRWVRIGIVSPAKADIWWSFTDEEPSIDEAGEKLSSAILRFGVKWLETESNETAFLRYAEEKLERTHSGARPHGSFLELRLMAAVCAWNGDLDDAAQHVAHARALWADERERLAAARKLYKKRHPNREGRLPAVPNLMRELESLISPTRTVETFRPPSSAPRRRSRSSRD